MASSRNKSFGKSGSSGLRMLWIPGKRKSHPKGRYDTTNKQISHSGGQKHSEIWSLGGSKAQKDLLRADPEANLFEGPSSSSVRSTACALGAVGAAKCASTTTINEIDPTAVADKKTPTVEVFVTDAIITPSSTASTAPLVSVPNSPEASTTLTIVAETTSTTSTATTSSINMPAKTTIATVTTTTTAEIMDENRFAILDKDTSNDFDVHDLPIPPKNGLRTPPKESALLNTSTGTTLSTATTPSPNTTPRHDDTKSEKDSQVGSPKKKKHHHKHNNNNHQNDINTIESLSDHSKIPSGDLDWVDTLYKEKPLSNEKKKKKISTTKEMDQLDGVPIKQRPSEKNADDDEKVVKCLYYTLMCCECTIS